MDLRGFASGVCEFNSRSGTSFCAMVKLSLLVCILILTFPDPLGSVMAFTQLSLTLKELYNLYNIYKTQLILSKCIQEKNTCCEMMCAVFSTLAP